jgi:sugar lactone lactonase YvrE
VDAAGDIYISDQNNNRIRKVDSKGIITTIAGSGTIAGYTSNRELSTDSEICNPSGLAVDAAGNLYMASVR